MGAVDIVESCAHERKCQGTDIIPFCKKAVTVTNHSVNVKRMIFHCRHAKAYSVRREKCLSNDLRKCSDDDSKCSRYYICFLMCLWTTIIKHCTVATDATQTIPRGMMHGCKRVVAGVFPTYRDIPWMCAYIHTSLAPHIWAALTDITYRFQPIIVIFYPRYEHYVLSHNYAN